MGTIIIHAGMPKTGSTSVQRWIIDNSARLRQEHGIQVVVAKDATGGHSSDELRLEPYESGRVNSGPLVKAWIGTQRSSAIAERFVEDLACFAERSAGVLVTAEALSQVFWRIDEPFLLGFEDLARRHDVRVAYYVRPQHAAIEANWREAGYKQGLTPSQYVVEQAKQGLHYLPTLEAVRRLAPSIEFGMRPSQLDLSQGTNPVEDFVRRFVSLPEDCPNVHSNPGLPLQLVNMLRLAPEGRFWHGNGAVETYPRWKYSAVFEGLDIVDSERIARSRLILQQYSHEVFEEENQALIRQLAWPIDAFVPPVDGLDDGWDIGELDALWTPDASEAELALLLHALRAALG